MPSTSRSAGAAGRPDYLAIGNVPYYITTPILFHSLETPRPRRSVFLVQREVAERVVALAGTSAYGALSVNVQALAEPTIAFTMPPGAFTPPPRVESALLRLVPRPDPVVTDDEQPDYSAFVIAAFGLRRKRDAPGAADVAWPDAGCRGRALGTSGRGPGGASGGVDADTVRGGVSRVVTRDLNGGDRVTGTATTREHGG